MATDRRGSTISWTKLRIALLSVLVLIGVGTGVLTLAKRTSDGPLTDMIPGGPLRYGPLVTDPDVDWQKVLGSTGTCSEADCPPMGTVELELVGPGTSRYTGIMVHQGELFVPCDLGFMWGRFDGTRRHVLHLIYLFKHWHEDALIDGRAVLRIDGKRYERHAERVTDPALIAALKSQLEAMARHWVAPEPLGQAPDEGPRDIWFFRMAPRATPL